MLLIIFTKSSLVFCTMDFGMFSTQFCTLQIRFATQKNNREYALAHPRFVILLYVHLKCLTHYGTHRVPAVTVSAAPIVIARVEVKIIRAEQIAFVERTRPIVTARTSVATVTIVAITRSGEKKTVAIIACHFTTIDTVLSSPGPSTIV